MIDRTSLEGRVDTLERDSRDHAKTLSEIIEKLNLLEKENHERRLIEVRAEERSIARTEQLERIEKDIAGIKAVGSRILWIIVVAVIGAFVTFVLRGGLMP